MVAVAVDVDVYVGTIHTYTTYGNLPEQLHTLHRQDRTTPARGCRKDATRCEISPVATAPVYSLGNLKSMVMIIRTIGSRLLVIRASGLRGGKLETKRGKEGQERRGGKQYQILE